MDTTQTLPPLTAASDGFEERDGVLLSWIGEDGDVIALGQNGAHLPRERVLAAMVEFTYGDTIAGVKDLDERWAIALPCDTADGCEGECTWHLQWSTDLNGIGPDTPGAFPITVLEA